MKTGCGGHTGAAVYDYRCVAVEVVAIGGTNAGDDGTKLGAERVFVGMKAELPALNGFAEAAVDHGLVF